MKNISKDEKKHTCAGGSETTVQSREALDLLDTDSTFGEDWARVGGQAWIEKCR